MHKLCLCSSFLLLLVVAISTLLATTQYANQSSPPFWWSNPGLAPFQFTLARLPMGTWPHAWLANARQQPEPQADSDDEQCHAAKSGTTHMACQCHAATTAMS